MSEKLPNTAQTLAQLGVSDPGRVPALFAEVRAAFDRASAITDSESAWKTFRDTWLGRKSGVLTLITDNWLSAIAWTSRCRASNAPSALII